MSCLPYMVGFTLSQAGGVMSTSVPSVLESGSSTLLVSCCFLQTTLKLPVAAMQQNNDFSSKAFSFAFPPAFVFSPPKQSLTIHRRLLIHGNVCAFFSNGVKHILNNCSFKMKHPLGLCRVTQKPSVGKGNQSI